MFRPDDLKNMLELALAEIEEFDGYNRPILDFIDDCENAMDYIDPSLETIFVKLIKFKLTNEARKSVRGKVFQNYNQFKMHMLSMFRPSINIYSLLNEASEDFRKSNESVLKFSVRLMKLKTYMNYVLFISPNQLFTDDFLNNLFLECFLNGLNPDISIKMNKIIESRNDITFQEAATIAAQIDNNPHLYRNFICSSIKTNLRVELNNQSFENSKSTESCKLAESNDFNFSLKIESSLNNMKIEPESFETNLKNEFLTDDNKTLNKTVENQSIKCEPKSSETVKIQNNISSSDKNESTKLISEKQNDDCNKVTSKLNNFENSTKNFESFKYLFKENIVENHNIDFSESKIQAKVNLKRESTFKNKLNDDFVTNNNLLEIINCYVRNVLQNYLKHYSNTNLNPVLNLYSIMT